ncbi:putative leucine-rich repeat-containing protein DDB_G0290503 [Condylostylus longicornis]|uniref:putative leucine-rich repeat-containing protein DDB_G0290503 n=1 Tax=Condylostylus longicornis TaxID=2530218 RepID=UPI00244E3DE6|nr:putative leucine-rich repeat-containing protein DDB_G0290503 [Condylostylus longicornis]
MSNNINAADIVKLFRQEFSNFKEDINKNLNERLDNNEKEFKRFKEDINENLNIRLENNKKGIVEEINNHLTQANERIKDLEEEVASLKNKLKEKEAEQNVITEGTERKIRKNNIIIGNVKETEGEKLLDLVTHFIKSIVKVPFVKENINFARRIGRKSNNPEKERPILLSLISFIKKEEILNNSKNLEGSKYYLKGDYTSQQRTIRSNLVKTKKQLEAEGKQVSIVKGSLIVNGKRIETITNPANVDSQKRLRSPEDPEKSKKGKVRKNSTRGNEGEATI